MRELAKKPRSPWQWFVWALGNVFIVAGFFALLYVGGLEAYSRGRLMGPDVPETPAVRQAPALALRPTPTSQPPLPVLNWDQAGPAVVLPTPSPLWRSVLTRIVIPAIGVDAAVIPVSWHVEQVGGQPVSVWDVAKWAVGHHQGSGNPGEGTNIVLAAHSGGFGALFRRLYELQPGDEVILYGAGRQYLYVIEEVLLLKEVGVPVEQRLKNAEYLAPTPDERITMVTCWPVHVYDHRVIALARPYRANPFPRPDFKEN
jgi:sortase A